MTRQTKTPRQRAEEALAVADRLVKRLEAKRSGLTEDLIIVEKELGLAKKRRDYLRANPDLPPQQVTSATSTRMDVSTGKTS